MRFHKYNDQYFDSMAPELGHSLTLATDWGKVTLTETEEGVEVRMDDAFSVEPLCNNKVQLLRKV